MNCANAIVEVATVDVGAKEINNGGWKVAVGAAAKPKNAGAFKVHWSRSEWLKY